MTVPHISVSTWSARRGRELFSDVRLSGLLARPTRTRTAVASGAGIAWVDVMIQVVVGTAMLYALWWVLASGVFAHAVQGAAGWYVDTIIPAFNTGTPAVLTGTDFTEGFFVPAPEPPAMLQYDGPATVQFEQAMGL
ncbi:hypothetical protein [Demequina gelatinilytica]|uniref:hypothetical protein n=1 Tax=Demequina gelatinilytica TaxID=1638980 RepID=UPI000B0506D0|nr:hypothetical protein [Demequina gelatinilytica]